MSAPASLSEDKLRSAESALAFVQVEHKKVLDGLHLEIQRLQQKCSGEKFALRTKYLKISK